MTNRKIYKKIKRTGITGSLISFLILFALTIGVMAVSGYFYIRYIRDAKFNTEYETVSYIRRLYDEGLASGTEPDALYSLMDTAGHDYIITDASGSILHISGEDTCSGNVVKAKLDWFSQQIDMYSDVENSYIRTDGDGNLTVRPALIMDLFTENNATIKITTVPIGRDDESDEDPDDDESFNGFDLSIISNNENDRFAELPYWISFDVGNDGRKLITKAFFTVNIRDLFLLTIISGAFVLLILAILIYSLISLIHAFKRQKRIVNYFFTDAVTGGNNWMWFQIKGDQLLKKWSSRNNNYAVVSLVLINFRNYCVCHSVSDGDRLLARISGEIRRNLSKKEMFAHKSSSSFALILHYDTEEELRQRINMLILRLETIEHGHKFNYQAGVSLIDKVLDANGKAVRRKSISLENEYNNASTARSTLADSDESGVAFFDEKIVEDQKWLDSVQEKQAQAIANEEFVVYYQPKYDPRTNELRGAEALIRWQSPDFGFVAPYKFIPIFEKNGFITEIDHYMLTHVARDQRRWLDAGYKCVPVSVNVSRAHFIESDLAEQIRDMVSAANCPHELIEIELTESAFFDDKKAMIETIRRLKDYGFAVSMDDFGAGYSSLNSLKDMPLDVLKLDADFFRGESADGRGEIVVSEAIKLAKSLNMRIVAEGVEVREQVDFLAGEGCDMIQGYYFAKPMPGNDYEQRMSN